MMRGTIWVTQTRTNSVTVYDLYTKRTVDQLRCAESENGSVSRPREVKVDARGQGKAFVSGSGGVTVFGEEPPGYSRD